ncbi:hypothetical protein G6717_01750 [Polynucleobacter paneuropaeus]|nr:hypothetical protein [Polynucleobacter paneuropaeus]
MNTEKIGVFQKIMQDEKRNYQLQVRGKEAWTTIYSKIRSEEINTTEFSAFATTLGREKRLVDSSWDIQIGEGAPGFLQSHKDGKIVTEYLHSAHPINGIEPIIIIQDHYGIKPNMTPQLAEDFRLFHNLWIDSITKNAIKVNNDGTEEIAAEISENFVRIRTKYLRQYQAARQLDLMLYIDSIENLKIPEGVKNFEEISEKEITELSCLSFNIGNLTNERYFSRLLAKSILPPPLIEHSGVWPYQGKDEQYVEFIIGEDENGKSIKHTCNPQLLSNYFGANPGRPQFLHPVFFKREVLLRYYEHSEKYTVSDGYLRCGSLWGLRLDNDHPDHVMVFLGDLGETLPESERDIWRGFNVPPTGSMSETVFRRSFLGQPTNPKSPDLVFKTTYLDFCNKWKENKNWQFFKQLHQADEHVLLRLRIPLNDSQSEFEDQIMNLTKLLIDSLNEEQLSKELVDKAENEKGIAKLGRWLMQNKFPETEKYITYLKRLQRLRSNITAHRKGSSYQKFLETERVNENFITEMTEQLVHGTKFLESVSIFFSIKL